MESDNYVCEICDDPAELLCFCARVALCQKCLGAHIMKDPSMHHRPIPLNSPEIFEAMRNSESALRVLEENAMNEIS